MPPNTKVRNQFGPQIGQGAAACRGACGGDCHPNNCKPDSYWECVGATRFRVVRTYDCHTHEACREHDDCLDECAQRFPGTGRLPTDIIEHLGGWRPERNFFVSECSSACHAEAALTWGLEATLSWADGREALLHPSDGRNVFEYSKDSPSAEELLYRCPQQMKLVCAPGGAYCEEDEEEEEEEDEEPPASAPVGVFVSPAATCMAEDERLPMVAHVVGLADNRVRWSVVDGPAGIDARGILRPNGSGVVTVQAESRADPAYLDQVIVEVGDCLCSFRATISGDSGRGSVEGDWAVFSTRGQASIMGAAAGAPEATEDLINTMRMTQKLMAVLGNQQAADQQEQALAELEEQLAEQQQASTGSTLGVNLIEAKIGGEGGRNMGNAFKLDVLADGSIAPGFAGNLPVRVLAMHTGEFASEGHGPWMFTWEAGDPGSVTLTVFSYDGERMRGRVDAQIEGLVGLITSTGSRPKAQLSAEFDAGAINPLRAQNVCMMAQALADAE